MKSGVTNYISLIISAWKSKAQIIGASFPRISVDVKNVFPDVIIDKRDEQGILKKISYPALLWAVKYDPMVDRTRWSNEEIHIKDSQISANHNTTEVREYPIPYKYTLSLTAEALSEYHHRILIDSIKAFVRERDLLEVNNIELNLDMFMVEDTTPFMRYRFNNQKFYRTVFWYHLHGWFDRHDHGVKAPVYPVAKTIEVRDTIIETELN